MERRHLARNKRPNGLKRYQSARRDLKLFRRIYENRRPRTNEKPEPNNFERSSRYFKNQEKDLHPKEPRCQLHRPPDRPLGSLLEAARGRVRVQDPDQGKRILETRVGPSAWWRGWSTCSYYWRDTRERLESFTNCWQNFKLWWGHKR